MEKKLMRVLFAGLFFVCATEIRAQVIASNFIVSTASARIAIAEESRLASKEGTTDEIKEYSALMIKDQGRLLGELKRLAVLRDITLPEDETYKDDLSDKSGRQFNSAYIRTMISEHERDVRLFRQAITCGDPEVSAFAERYLPVIESHLKMIKSIKKR